MATYQFNAVTTAHECEYCHAEVAEGFVYQEESYFCDLDCFTEVLLMNGILEEFEGGNDNG